MFQKKSAIFMCLILIIALCISLSSCGSTSDVNKLTGSWVLISGKTDVTTFSLYSDGTCLVEDENGTWTISDGTLKILGTWAGNMFWDHDTIIGNYEIQKNTLTISNVILDGRSVDYVLTYELQ